MPLVAEEREVILGPLIEACLNRTSHRANVSQNVIRLRTPSHPATNSSRSLAVMVDGGPRYAGR